MRRLQWLGLLITIATMVVSCVPTREALDDQPDFTGVIPEVVPDGEHVLGRVLVEAKVTTEDGEYLDKYWVTVTSDTSIVDQVDEERRSVDFEALATGQRVRVWFSGPVAESYPAQVDAARIVIQSEATIGAVEGGGVIDAGGTPHVQKDGPIHVLVSIRLAPV